MTVQLRALSKNKKYLESKRDILVYDLITRQLKWGKYMVYQNSSLWQYDNTMILTKGNKSYCLDIHTGMDKWQAKNDIYYIHPTD